MTSTHTTYGSAFQVGKDPTDFFDEFGHGTKMACIIGARPGFDGVVGLVPRVRLFNCRVLDERGLVDPDALAEAVEAIVAGRRDREVRVALLAIDHRVWQSKVNKSYTERILKTLDASDVVTVIAASDTPGGRLNLDNMKEHPASIGRELDIGSLLVVAAHHGARGNEELTRTSNLGPKTVHLAASGRGIPAASPMAPVPVYGTSAAAALVAGAAALIAGKEGGSAKGVRDQLLDLCRSVENLSGQVMGGRVLDLSGLR